MLLRKILCVGQEPPSAALAVLLRDCGWEAVSAIDLASARRLHAQLQPDVGLLLGGQPAAAVWPAWLEECFQLPGGMEWVGLFDEEVAASPVLRDWVLSHLFDYHASAVAPQALGLTLHHAERRARLRRQAGDSARDAAGMGLVGQSGAMARLRRDIRKMASTEAPVLIGGESGSGKELAARAIHQGSRRAGGPFITVNCGAITPSLIHSELFGHERGAFTGATTGKVGLIEAANGGTIFFDEIAELPLELQTSLLRFLQEHSIHRVGSTRSLPVDARVVAASHMDPAHAVAAGRFREDLFYRLNVLPLTVPALRDHLSDVPQLAQHFLQRCLDAQRRRRVEGFSRPAMTAMMAHDWQGNVRELYNRVQRALVMTDQRLITPDDLGLATASGPACAGLDAVRAMAERDAIALALGRVGRNVTQAARELGVSRMTLYRLMDKHGLTPVRSARPAVRRPPAGGAATGARAALPVDPVFRFPADEVVSL